VRRGEAERPQDRAVAAQGEHEPGLRAQLLLPHEPHAGRKLVALRDEAEQLDAARPRPVLDAADQVAGVAARVQHDARAAELRTVRPRARVGLVH
jgi:hypothetical protein